MARTKKVFKADQVIELFVTQAQDEARTTNSSYTGTPSVYFKGTTINSYGDHFIMGIILDGDVLLIAQADSSVTTNKHLNNLWNTAKCNGLSVIEVQNVSANNEVEHDANIEDMLKQRGELLGKASRARKPSYIEMYKRDADHFLVDIVNYRTLFGLTETIAA